jgi:hypothetical protein
MKKNLLMKALMNIVLIFIAATGFSQYHLTSAEYLYKSDFETGLRKPVSSTVFLATADCPEGILGLWRLDEAAGPVYNDINGEHTITAEVSPVATDGIIGRAQSFDANTKMDIPDNGNEFEWEATSDFSFELWIRTASTTGTMVLLGRYRNDVAAFPAASNFWVGLNNGRATFSLRDNTGPTAGLPGGKYYEITGGPNLGDNEWHHIIAVRDGANQINRLYVDGLKVANVATTYANAFSAPEPTEINLGWFDDNAGTAYHFIGAIDEVTIFKSAVTDEEASSYYGAGSPQGHCTGGDNNHAPSFTSNPGLAVDQGKEYVYDITVADSDAGDAITITAPTMPAWLKLTFTQGEMKAQLKGTPAKDNVGDNNIVLQVSDGKANTKQTFTIKVANVNDPPDFTSTPVTDININTAYSYTATATDVDGDNVTLSVVKKPDWLSFDPATGKLTGTPTAQGSHEIILRASDGTMFSDQKFTIAVSTANGVNDLKESGITIYPVPAATYLDIDLGKNSYNVTIQVINSSGQVILSGSPGQVQKIYRLGLGNMNNGQYYIRIRTNELDVTGSFIITK